MTRIIHARLDDESERIVVELERRTGWSASRIVREGIKALYALLPGRGGRKVYGLGRFQSGIPDLGSSKEHLEGFGQ